MEILGLIAVAAQELALGGIGMVRLAGMWVEDVLRP